MNTIPADRRHEIGQLITIDDRPYIVTACTRESMGPIRFWELSYRSLTPDELSNLQPDPAGNWQWKIKPSRDPESKAKSTKIPVYNSDLFATDFRSTSTGPIALIDGVWYSVNGSVDEITDIRFALKSIVLKVESQPEIYAGEPTGKTVFYTSRFATEYVPMAGVLGRGHTPEASVADWKRRAADDGHDLSYVVFTVNS